MTVQTGKVAHTHNELANLMKLAFQYEKLRLLKSPQNKAASNIAITEKIKTQLRYITKQMAF